jgi:hypothetical protein
MSGKGVAVAGGGEREEDGEAGEKAEAAEGGGVRTEEGGRHVGDTYVPIVIVNGGSEDEEEEDGDEDADKKADDEAEDIDEDEGADDEDAAEVETPGETSAGNEGPSKRAHDFTGGLTAAVGVGCACGLDG